MNQRQKKSGIRSRSLEICLPGLNGLGTITFRGRRERGITNSPHGQDYYGEWGYIMRSLKYAALALAFMSALPLAAKETTLTIVHTNDLHSHLLGFSPNVDYTPTVIHDDETMGGWARIATVIKEVKRERDNPVLVLDAGDFLMGSLFHTLSREEAFELRLMKAMGYDIITLGNHEFDLMPHGLARILETAYRQGEIPAIVLSNAVFSEESDKDDSLDEVFQQGIVKPYTILEKEDIRIGFFGLMGKDAAQVAPFAAPVKFTDPVMAARAMVRELRDNEKADIVICLSHSGLDLEDENRSEDEILARKVDGIDVIISGHTHTRMDAALRIRDTIIVQAWGYGKQVGVLDLIYRDGVVSLGNQAMVNIDDSISGDARISDLIQSFESLVNERVLAEAQLSFREVIAHTDFELRVETDESNLGNLITDSIRWYINSYDYDPDDPATKVALAVISNGVIRDQIVPGKTGEIAVCDAFRAIPLGIGMDDTIGYPLISFYVYPSEIKRSLEILTSIYPRKGGNYFIQISGAKFTYNPNRMIFDRVTDIWIGSEEEGYMPLDYSASNKALYRVAADIYNATFLKVVGDYTWHILDIVPKDRQGNPIMDLKMARVDADRERQGIQELKEWMGVIEYIRNFPDTNGDSVPDVPGKYRGKGGRIVVEASWNPFSLVKRGSYVTWIGLIAVFVVFIIMVFVLWFVGRRIKRRRHK